MNRLLGFLIFFYGIVFVLWPLVREIFRSDNRFERRIHRIKRFGYGSTQKRTLIGVSFYVPIYLAGFLLTDDAIVWGVVLGGNLLLLSVSSAMYFVNKRSGTFVRVEDKYRDMSDLEIKRISNARSRKDYGYYAIWLLFCVLWCYSWWPILVPEQ